MGKLRANVQDNIIHNGQRVKIIQCPSTGEWIDNVLYPYKGALFNNKKERATDPYYKMGKPYNRMLSREVRH